jgi:hypothetical protein
MVNATVADLKKAFTMHGKVYKKAFDNSHRLILFYAAECGLKALFLKQRNLKDTNSSQLAKTYSHQLDKIVKDCHIPAFVATFDNPGGKYPIKNFHEHMRYGVLIPNPPLQSQFAYLEAIVNELEKQL